MKSSKNTILVIAVALIGFLMGYLSITNQNVAEEALPDNPAMQTETTDQNISAAQTETTDQNMNQPTDISQTSVVPDNEIVKYFKTLSPTTQFALVIGLFVGMLIFLAFAWLFFIDTNPAGIGVEEYQQAIQRLKR